MNSFPNKFALNFYSTPTPRPDPGQVKDETVTVLTHLVEIVDRNTQKIIYDLNKSTESLLLKKGSHFTASYQNQMYESRRSYRTRKPFFQTDTETIDSIDFSFVMRSLKNLLINGELPSLRDPRSKRELHAVLNQDQRKINHSLTKYYKASLITKLNSGVNLAKKLVNFRHFSTRVNLTIRVAIIAALVVAIAGKILGSWVGVAIGGAALLLLIPCALIFMNYKNKRDERMSQELRHVISQVETSAGNNRLN